MFQRTTQVHLEPLVLQSENVAVNGMIEIFAPITMVKAEVRHNTDTRTVSY